MKVVEKFVSINGEGQKAGQLALFIRFAGCNLNCLYCDTAWANEETVYYEEFRPDELVDIIYSSGIDNVTLTGGEPLMQADVRLLLQGLEKGLNRNPKLRVEIETNGSIDIRPYLDMNLSCVTFTIDYKTSASGMEAYMCNDNFQNVRGCDTGKFVVGSRKDLLCSKEIIDKYHLIQKGCGIYLSPCFGQIDASEMVDFLVDEKLNGVNIQLQLHKYIWDKDARGV